MAVMDLTKHIMAIYNKLSNDEELLRLLFYIAEDRYDDVLDAKKRPNIIGNESLLKSGHYDAKAVTTSEIINDVLQLSKVNDDLNEDEKKCRVSFYLDSLDNVYSSTGALNITLLDANVVFDIYTHYDYEKVDFRMTKILNRLYNLLYASNTTGMGKWLLVTSAPITDKEETYKGYNGYRLKFKFSISTPA